MTKEGRKTSYVFIVLIFSLLTAFDAYAEIIYAGGGSKCKTLGEALELSAEGDTVILKSGIYKEYGLVIDRKIVLLGEGNPVIDAENRKEILTVRAGGTVVKGITFRNTGVSFMTDMAAVRVEDADNCLVTENRIENSFFAIYLSNSSGTVVSFNRIAGNSKSESFSGNGIHVWNCRRIIIIGNDIDLQRDGIYLEFATNSIVALNRSSGNIRYGLHFMFSEGNKYVLNTFRGNGAGVAVMYTKKIDMFGNTFDNNWGENSYGLLLKDIDNSRIFGNSFLHNTVGIYAEGSNNLLISGNNFRGNGWAMKMLGNCENDIISRNNFVSNTFDVTTNSSKNNNVFRGNFWDKYDGYDLDRDGTGDVPYRPVSLFSVIVERSPESVVLLESFFTDILDVTEKVIPVFTPETLVDEHPSMSMYSYD